MPFSPVDLDTSHVVPNRKPTVAGNVPDQFIDSLMSGRKVTCSSFCLYFFENILRLPFFPVRLYTRADPKPIRTNQIQHNKYKESQAKEKQCQSNSQSDSFSRSKSQISQLTSLYLYEERKANSYKLGPNKPQASPIATFPVELLVKSYSTSTLKRKSPWP